MPLVAGLQTLVPLQILKWPCYLVPYLKTAVEEQVCQLRDSPSDTLGALQRARWEPLPSTHLITGLPFANPIVYLEVDCYPSASSTDQGPEGSSIFPGTRQGLCPPEPLVKGLPTTDAAAGPAATT